MSTATERLLTAPRGSRGRRPRDAGAESEPKRLIHFGHWWWALPAIVLMVGAVYLSTATGAFYAFTDWKGLGSFDIVGFDNFARIFKDPKMITALVNTLLLAAGFVVGTNVVGMSLALALNRTVRSRLVLRALLFMPVILSPLAVSYLWRFIFEYDGPLNGLLAGLGLSDWQRTWLADPTWSLWVVLFVMLWQASGIAMVIYIAGLAGVPEEIEEAAALDGAGAWTRFWRVIVPSVRSSIVIALTLTTIQGLRTFDQIIALTGGGPAGATETMATQVWKQAFVNNSFGYGAAIALVLTLIILVFAVAQQAAGRERARGM
ncbi:MAG: sugar ABC transporter permease [Microbacterium sp.]|uniref:carbohydrate ABC transporter permease n=1 Tax=Microbacterium sp. TaxID=51671 RepID=UPI0039E33CC3